MQIPATSNVNSLNKQDIRSKPPVAKPAVAPPAPARPQTDADGDNDGSRIGTQVDVTV